jgi:hypothetical protein
MSASRLKADVLGHAINGACQNPGVVVSSIPRWDKGARIVISGFGGAEYAHSTK